MPGTVSGLDQCDCDDPNLFWCPNRHADFQHFNLERVTISLFQHQIQQLGAAPEPLGLLVQPDLHAVQPGRESKHVDNSEWAARVHKIQRVQVLRVSILVPECKLRAGKLGPAQLH